MEIKKTLVILAIITVAYFLLQPGISEIRTDAGVYKEAVLNETPERFSQPLLYFIAHDLLFFIEPELLFYWLPLLFSLIGFFAVIQIFRLYDVEPEYLILIFPVILSILFLFEFMRDSLLWALANLFFYFALKLKRETNLPNFFLAFSFALLSYLTKDGGLILFIFLTFILAEKFKWKVILPGTLIAGILAIFHERTSLLVGRIMPKIENISGIWAVVVNPLFITSIIGFTKIKFSELKFAVLLAYFGSFFVINSNAPGPRIYYEGVHVFRYTFFLSGILMLCVALLLKRGGKTSKVILAILGIYILDLIIHFLLILGII